MPEIKIKHVVSFSSEDKIHKAENILKSETYRKWKCAGPGEKSASIVLQFEKATQIHSIDIGNESSAFVEVLVGRSSDTVKDYQVLLVASSFMSPLESRNETHTNRVRMFGPDKLSQNVKDEKWDCVQVVCTQPFNKNITYGLSFIKFHSPPEKNATLTAESEAKNATVKFGAFRLKYQDEDEEQEVNSPPIAWLERKNKNSNNLTTSNQVAPSYAAAVLASSNSTLPSQKGNSVKRKSESTEELSKPPPKKESTISHVNKEKVGYKDILGPKKDAASPSIKTKETKEDVLGAKKTDARTLNQSMNGSKASSSNQQGKQDTKRSFNKIMERVVFVISGFVNPLRGEIRDKALEMGAKYKGDWDKSCTHLICAFVNTPKYVQVRRQGGRIVTKDWILDCHKKKVLLDWKLYMLGKYTMDSSEESSSEEEAPRKKLKVKKVIPKLTGQPSNDTKNAARPNRKAISSSDSDEPSLIRKGNATEVRKPSPKKNPPPKPPSEDSETPDEDAIKDYVADTDVDSESGGDTEDEIRKVEEEALRKAAKSAEKAKKEESCEDDSDSSLLLSKVDTTDMPLPELPNLFKKRHFFLYGDFAPKKHHDLQRLITAYNGVVEEYMAESIKYVVTESKWDKNFDEALDDNEDLIFVKPEWIFKCQESMKLVPYQPYIVTPNS